MEIIYEFLAGGWVELCSFACAIVYGRADCTRKGHDFLSKDTGLSILHGCAIFPLILIIVGSFIPQALWAAVHSHNLILAGAGVVALFSMLEA